MSNLTLEEYMLNYGRPYRNDSLKKLESVTTWRVVNEDPSESYIGRDEEFDQETVDPLSKYINPIRNLSWEKAKSFKIGTSVERKSNIKLSVLSALKRNGKLYRKQKSTSGIVNDFERKISSPLIQNKMSAFF